MRFRNVGKFIKRHSHQILAVVSSVGVVVTTVESVKAGIKIQKKIAAAEEAKGESLTTKEKIVLGAEDMAIPMAAGAATVGSIAAGTIVSEKAIVGLSAVVATKVAQHNEYREAVKTIDPKVDAQAVTFGAKGKVEHFVKENPIKPDDELVLYFDTHTGQTFRGRPNLTLYVEGRLMDIMLRKGNYSENEYRLLMGEMIDPIAGNYYGWNQYSFMNQDSIDPHLEIYEELFYTDDGLEYHVITLSNEPDADFIGSECAGICSHFDVR